jgi:hypothetical protein
MSTDDRAWLAFFVRPNTSPAVQYLTEEQKTQVKEQHKKDAAIKRELWSGLDEAERARQVRCPSVTFDHLTHVSQHQEGLEYAAGLVSSLVDEIITFMDHRRRMDPLRSSDSFESTQTRLRSPPRPLHLISSLLESQSIVASSHAYGAPIVQVDVHEQMNNPSCGYYALHNGLACVEAALSGSEELARMCIANLSSSIDFWSRYWRLHAFLLSQCSPESTYVMYAHWCAVAHTWRSKYPWGVKHIESRVMEREYMTRVLQCWVCVWLAAVECDSFSDRFSGFRAQSSLSLYQSAMLH